MREDLLDVEFDYDDIPPAPPEEAFATEEQVRTPPMEIPAEPGAQVPEVRPAFDTRTPEDMYSPDNIVEAAATGETEAPAKYLTNVPEKAAAAKEQGYDVFFGEDKTAEKKPETKLGKYPERQGFRKHIVDQMFNGEDPEKLNPFEIGERTRREYLQGVMGGKPFYETKGISTKTLQAIQKEADDRAKEARDIALRVRQERLKTIDRYLQRFDTDYKRTTETMIWANVDGKPYRMTNEQIQAAQREGRQVTPYEKAAGTGKPGRRWASIDGTEGLYTDDEIVKATQEGQEVSQYRTPGQKIEARQKALKIAGTDFGGLTPVKDAPGFYIDQMAPGKLRRINEEFKIAGIPPLKEEAVDWTQWPKPLGVELKGMAQTKRIYKYTHEDGTLYGEEPSEVATPKRQPTAPVADYGTYPVGGGRVDMEGYVVDWDKNKDPVKVIHKQSGLKLPIYKDLQGTYWVIDPNTSKPHPFIVDR